MKIDVGLDAQLYVSDLANKNLRVVGTDGVIDTITDAIVPLEGLQAGEERPVTAVNDDGTLYASNGVVVQRMDADSGEFTTIAGGGAFSLDDGSDRPATEAALRITDMAVSGGTAYVAHRAGTFDWRVRAIDEDGTITTVAGGGELGLQASEGQTATEAQLTDITSLAVDSRGTIYLAEDVAEGPQDDGTYSRKGWYIRKVDEDGTISTVLGDAGSGFSGDGGPAAEAEIDQGMGDMALAVDAEDRLLFIDGSNHGNNVVRRIDGDGVITSIAPAWYLAQDIAVGPDGHLYFAAPGRVFVMALNENGLPVEHGIGERPAPKPADDPWADEEAGTVLTVADADSTEVVGEPRGLAVGADGTIHVVGSRDDSVLTIDTEGETARLPTGVGTTYPPDLTLTDVEVGTDGSVYVAVGGAVLRIYPDASTAVVAGNGSRRAGVRGNQGYEGQLAITAAVDEIRLASGWDGTLYLADSLSNRVYELGEDGRLSTLAEHGFTLPGGLAVGPDGHIYVGDEHSEQLREIAPHGEVSIVAGRGLPTDDDPGGGGSDGGTNLISPSDVAVDRDDTAYLATSRGIKRIDADGEVETVVQPPDENATDPVRLANLGFDAHGNLYFTETPGGRVRVMVRPGEISDPFPWGIVSASSAAAVLVVVGSCVVVIRRRRRAPRTPALFTPRD